MYLPAETFRTVVAATPLVSLDLVVQRTSGEILLGERLNRSARGYWFVPGGRIRKSEHLDDAFRRLTHDELGQVFERVDAQLLGVYEHFYFDSVFGAPPAYPDTHCIVLAYRLGLRSGQALTPPIDQHARYGWWSLELANASAEVPENTRAYLSALA